MDFCNLCLIITLVLFTLVLISFPVFGLVSVLKKRDLSVQLQGSSVLAGFMGFLILSVAAIFSYPNLYVKLAFCFIFGIGNALLWPYLIGKLASARKEVVFYWFALTLFPIAYLWFLIYVFNFSR